MSERTVRCDQCRFWEDHGEVGECRRYPPQLPTRMLMDLTGDDPWAGEWPEVSRDAWCGEFVPLPSEATIEGEVRE